MIDYSFYIIISYLSAFFGLFILFIFSYKDFLISNRKIRNMEKLKWVKVKISFLLIVSAASLFLILFALRDNVIFFYSPSEVQKKFYNNEINNESLVRLGGLVLDKSLHRDKEGNIYFIITDLKKEINVLFSGILPDLFREGQGVIAQGYVEKYNLKDDNDLLENNLRLRASSVLAKHDENYMPPEVLDILEGVSTNDG